jgi:hypothetical protein
MSNTYNADLLVDTISERSQTILGSALAPLSVFSSNFSDEVKRPKDTIQVPLVTATAATQTNPTSFNGIGGTTVGAAEVALNHYYQPFGLAYGDLQNGRKLEQLVDIQLKAFADKLWAVSTAPITTANFGAAVVEKDSADINATSGDLPKLWAAIHKSRRKALIVDPTIYSNLIPTNRESLPLSVGAYGFDAGVFYATAFPSETDLEGFAISPEAVAVASAAPALEGFREGMIVSQVVNIEGINLPVYWNVWADKTTRSIVASVEVMFGSGKGITSGTAALIMPAA